MAVAANAENYGSCLVHDSEAYLKAFKNKLDKEETPNIQIIAKGRPAICVLPSDEKEVMGIMKEFADNMF